MSSTQKPTSTELEVEGRSLTLSNLNKVLYPASSGGQAAFTKGQVLDYYIRIAPVLLPQLRGRPLTMKRYPNGVSEGHFFEKQCPSFRPAWVQTVDVPSGRTPGKVIRYCLVEDLPTLVWVANLAAIELHPLLACGAAVDQPTEVAFDLDPGPPADILDCARVAGWVREVLDDLGLASFPKTSGSKGLQIYVPLNTPHTYDHTKPFAHAIARLLERDHPEQVLEKMDKSLRRNKVFIDWSQNHITKTTICAYSLRARARPTVSTPVTWDEVERALAAKDPAMLSFEASEVLERVSRLGDLFGPVEQLEQHLPQAG